MSAPRGSYGSGHGSSSPASRTSTRTSLSLFTEEQLVTLDRWIAARQEAAQDAKRGALAH